MPDNLIEDVLGASVHRDCLDVYDFTEPLCGSNVLEPLPESEPFRCFVIAFEVFFVWRVCPVETVCHEAKKPRSRSSGAGGSPRYLVAWCMP